MNKFGANSLFHFRYWDWDGNKNLKTYYNYMDLVILEKIGPSILNGLGYIVHLEKKNGSKITLNWVILPEK